MTTKKPTNKLGLQGNERGRSLSVYFMAKDEEMLQELSRLTNEGKIQSISHFITQATRRHFESNRKELSL